MACIGLLMVFNLNLILGMHFGHYEANHLENHFGNWHMSCFGCSYAGLVPPASWWSSSFFSYISSLGVALFWDSYFESILCVVFCKLNQDSLYGSPLLSILKFCCPLSFWMHHRGTDFIQVYLFKPRFGGPTVLCTPISAFPQCLDSGPSKQAWGVCLL